MRPLASVVVVAYGGAAELDTCLDSVRRHTGPDHEVVVVVNPRPDDPVADPAGADVVVRNDRNVGFGPAVDQAALVAVAPRLALLNPDALVGPGWLEPLVAALDADPAAVAVSPRLVDPDATVQEVGSVLGRGGHSLALGRPPAGALAGDRHVHAVDYASAACLVVDRTAFVAAGGFDAVFAPGYFEDADLAQRWGVAGRRVLVEPSVAVTHARHASFGAAGAVARMDANRPVVAARWSARLADRPPLVDFETRPHRLWALRDLTRPDRLLAVLDQPRPDRVAAVVDLARRRPDLAVTLAVPAGTDVPSGPRIERVDAAAVGERWLRDRLLHHPHVVLDEAADDRLAHLVAVLQRPVTAVVGDLGPDPEGRLGLRGTAR